MLLTSCASSDIAYDVLINNGTIYDGSLGVPVAASIGIADGRIVSMDADPLAPADRVIDAHGKLVMPGFIDPHTHARSGLSKPQTRAGLNYLMQGVTTVFIGNDGRGVPNRDENFEELRENGFGPNIGWFVGHGEVRQEIMGMADRKATVAELDAMKALIESAMRDGAVGISSGLFYAPGSYAPTEEVVALAAVASQYGGIYDSHIRSESSHGIGLMASLDEVIHVAREARIPAHISHLKALGEDVWGKSTEIVGRIEQARSDGLDVTANQYPWEASGTRFSNALIPKWVMADSKEMMRRRLADPELFPGIEEEMRNNLRLRGGPGAMLITAADNQYVGMTLADVAALTNQDPLVAAIDLVLDDDPSIASFVMHRDDIDRLAVQPWVMTGSDGSSGHPRLYGTYPKAWRDFVVERKLMSAEQFVHRSSGLVADTFGLCDRGYLRPGYVADIAIIDPQEFRPVADYRNPTALSVGIAYVLVGGVLIVDDGHTGALPGKIIAKPRCD